jgi:hypothetical protein
VSAKSDLREHLRAQLFEGEEVLVVTTVQVEGGQKRALASSTIASTATTLAIQAATGGTMGLLVLTAPPAAWFVGTTERVLLIQRTNHGRKLGDVVFVAPRAAVSATLKTGLLSQVTIADRSDGKSLLRLNVGAKRGLAKQLVSSVEDGSV